MLLVLSLYKSKQRQQITSLPSYIIPLLNIAPVEAMKSVQNDRLRQNSSRWHTAANHICHMHKQLILNIHHAHTNLPLLKR